MVTICRVRAAIWGRGTARVSSLPASMAGACPETPPTSHLIWTPGKGTESRTAPYTVCVGGNDFFTQVLSASSPSRRALWEEVAFASVSPAKQPEGSSQILQSCWVQMPEMASTAVMLITDIPLAGTPPGKQTPGGGECDSQAGTALPATTQTPLLPGGVG